MSPQLHVYAIDAPNTDLHGETFEIQDSSRDAADARAAARVKETFVWAPHRFACAVFVRSYASRESFRKAEGSGVRLSDAEVDTVIGLVLAEDLKAVGQ